MTGRQPLGQPSRELLRARELLADGRWHDYERVLRELIKIIPPGRAVREAEKLRVAQAGKRARYTGRTAQLDPARRGNADLDKLRETGARSIARKMLNGATFDITPPGTHPRRIRWPRQHHTNGDQ